MTRALALLAVIAAIHPPTAWADDDDGSQQAKKSPVVSNLSLAAGSEYDSNIHRLEVPDGEAVPVEGAPLFRATARARGSLRVNRRTRVHFSTLFGGKLFLEEAGQSENVIIASGDLRVEHALRSRRALTFIRAGGYESWAFDPTADNDESRGRNFALRLTELGVVVPGPGSHRLSIHAGVQDFTYKPDADFDWVGDHYGLGYRTVFWRGDPDEELDASSIDLAVRYQLGRRQYSGAAFTNNCAESMPPDPTCIVPTMLDRADLHHAVRADASYTGERVWSAAYELQLSDSNSFGQSLLRQRVELGVTTDTWAGIYLTARATVMFTTFLDPLLLARDVQSQTFVTIDDENRNSLDVTLSRDVAKRWSAEARYAIYTNEFATRELSFRRQIGYLGLAYRFGP